MNNSCILSIRCFVYNHEPYLRQCLDGFVMQKTNFVFEAIVHDDASTDGSANIIREYAEKYPDIIKPIYETENQYSKHDGSLRRIMDSALSPSSKYLAICEGDDYWTDPYKLQKQIDALEAHPECSICFAKVATVSKEGNPMRGVYPNRNIKNIFSLSDFMRWEFLEGSWVFHTSCFVYRREYLSSYGDALKTKFAHFPHGDLTIQLHCLEHGLGIFIPDFVSCYRILSGGYNSYVDTHVDFAIKENEKKVLGLKDYDAATNYKYHKELRNAVLSIELNNDKIGRRFWGFFNKKYFPLYNNKSPKDFIIIFLDYYFPSVLNSLVRIKHKMYK